MLEYKSPKPMVISVLCEPALVCELLLSHKKVHTEIDSEGEQESSTFSCLRLVIATTKLSMYIMSFDLLKHCDR